LTVWTRLRGSRVRLRLPRRTVRLRLTLLYGGLFLLCSIALLAVTNLAVRTSAGRISVTAGGSANGQVFRAVTPDGLPAGTTTTGGPILPAQVRALIKASQANLKDSQAHLEHVLSVAAALPGTENRQLLLISAIALAVMTLVSIWLGWIVAGRVLSPLRTITAGARDISATNLHRRLALGGPDDELHELGDTFDELLARLEASFEAQRQFVANASHELRTPLARQRTLAEVALGDPDATVESLRASLERLVAAGEEQEGLIEALLTLARSERGIVAREPLDLAALSERVLAGRRVELRRRRLRLNVTLEAAPTAGEPRLAERLIANLVDNAIAHNRRGGSVNVSTGSRDGWATLTVANSGPIIPADQVERLLQPFQRLSSTRGRTTKGSGLGLSIAASIARAHGGTLTVEAQPEGGLIVRANFPAT
jgi:signal transduction histidine kinase